MWQDSQAETKRMSLVVTDFASRRTMMVDTQVRPSDVTKFPIIDAMLKVERENFLPEAKREAAYVDANIELAEGRVALEPRTFARMLDALNIQPSEMVLDIGTGLGYSAAVIARLADTVVAVEELEEIAGEAQTLLSASGSDNAAVIEGPLVDGAAKHGPYDVIIAEGGVEVLPEAITDQLADGGRMAVLFMEGALGTVRIGYKAGKSVTWRDSFNASAPVLPGFARQDVFSL